VNVLITGAFGFVGKHLARELSSFCHTAHAFDVAVPQHYQKDVWASVHTGDIQNINSLISALKDSKADACCHLAGMAFVPDGWNMPQQLFEINLIGTINVLEACRKISNKNIKILFASSAEVYGYNQSASPLTELSPLNPDNPYAVSKASADMMTLLYAKKELINTVVARPYNHIGPEQSTKFAVPSFALQLLAIQNKKSENKIYVGNLKSRRYFTDVRDVVRAYRLLLEKGISGNAYNISSSQKTSLEEILQMLCNIIGVHPQIEIDPSRFRPADNCPELDITKIKQHTDWQPLIPLKKTLEDTVKALKK
jgi:GDP-4-dehydro-6-deoxy-D-mannose reductase